MLALFAELKRSPGGRKFLIWGGGATLILLCMVVAIRFDQFELGIDAFAIEDLSIQSDDLGIAMEQLFIPFVGIFLLSTTTVFQKSVTGSRFTLADRRRLSLLLFSILTLNLFATVWQNDDFFLGVTDGLLIVMIGGLLAGGRVGLLLGSYVLAFYAINSVVLEESPLLDEGLFESLFWTLTDLEVLTTVWAGTVIGRWRDARVQLPFLPYRLFLLGFLVEWLSAWLALIGYGEIVLLEQLPAALITGLSLMVLGLLIQQLLGREAKQRLAAAEQAQSMAELKALRAQINPHFLFNALSTIKYHARTEPETAYELLDDLSDVFHTALRSEPFVHLADELDTIKSYLAIEQARLRERLTVHFDIDDTVDLGRKVPALILQPLVENSVIHGISPQRNGGTISIQVTNGGNGCQISICDDGVGFDPTNVHPTGSGIGLTNSRERLIALYGPTFAPEIRSAIGAGTLVIVKIPNP